VDLARPREGRAPAHKAGAPARNQQHENHLIGHYLSNKPRKPITSKFVRKWEFIGNLAVKFPMWWEDLEEGAL
jgi:hypothetical protein